MMDPMIAVAPEPIDTNPITVYSQKGLQAIGKLMRFWTLDASSRPEGRLEGRTYVMSREVFVDALATAGLAHGVEYEMRDGVDEVELYMRDPSRLTLTLPEPDVLDSMGQTPSYVRVPVLDYEGKSYEAGPVPKGQDASHKMLKLDGDGYYDPYGAFIDSYLAAYSCTQCK